MTFQLHLKNQARRAFAALSTVALAGTFLVPLAASAQNTKQASDVVGTWILAAG